MFRALSASTSTPFGRPANAPFYSIAIIRSSRVTARTRPPAWRRGSTMRASSASSSSWCPTTGTRVMSRARARAQDGLHLLRVQAAALCDHGGYAPFGREAGGGRHDRRPALHRCVGRKLCRYDTILVKPQTTVDLWYTQISASSSAAPASRGLRGVGRHGAGGQARMRSRLLRRIPWAGKSTLARNLGRMFHRRFVDTDRLVERRCGSTVARVFEELGEDRFRELETAVLEGLRSERSLLVSCGGGVVETPRNIELMHEMGYCVYLDGDLDDSLRQNPPLRHPTRFPQRRARRASARTSPPVVPTSRRPYRGYSRHLVHRCVLYRCRTALGAWSDMTIRRKLLNFGTRSTDLRFGCGAFPSSPNASRRRGASLSRLHGCRCRPARGPCP